MALRHFDNADAYIETTATYTAEAFIIMANADHNFQQLTGLIDIYPALRIGYLQRQPVILQSVFKYEHIIEEFCLDKIFSLNPLPGDDMFVRMSVLPEEVATFLNDRQCFSKQNFLLPFLDRINYEGILKHHLKNAKRRKLLMSGKSLERIEANILLYENALALIENLKNQ